MRTLRRLVAVALVAVVCVGGCMPSGSDTDERSDGRGSDRSDFHRFRRVGHTGGQAVLTVGPTVASPVAEALSHGVEDASGNPLNVFAVDGSGLMEDFGEWWPSVAEVLESEHVSFAVVEARHTPPESCSIAVPAGHLLGCLERVRSVRLWPFAERLAEELADAGVSTVWLGVPAPAPAGFTGSRGADADLANFAVADLNERLERLAAAHGHLFVDPSVDLGASYVAWFPVDDQWVQLRPSQPAEVLCPHAVAVLARTVADRAFVSEGVLDDPSWPDRYAEFAVAAGAPEIADCAVSLADDPEPTDPGQLPAR